jgi:hypothetical protein
LCERVINQIANEQYNVQLVMEVEPMTPRK